MYSFLDGQTQKHKDTIMYFGLVTISNQGNCMKCPCVLHSCCEVLKYILGAALHIVGTQQVSDQRPHCICISEIKYTILKTFSYMNIFMLFLIYTALYLYTHKQSYLIGCKETNNALVS